MSGFMGLVEFGSRTGIQLPAGKSYQGMDGSPCMAGMMKGAAFTGLGTELVVVVTVGCAVLCAEALDAGASSTATRSCLMTASEK